MIEITIPLQSRDEAVLVLGPYDRFAKLMRQELDIELFTREGNLRLKGADGEVLEAQRRIDHLLGKIRKGRELNLREIEEILLGKPKSEKSESAKSASHSRQSSNHSSSASSDSPGSERKKGVVRFRARGVEPRGENQRHYMDMMTKLDLVFGTGVAGTGKTFLAVAAAVQALRNGEVRKLIITRPVVEAGEHLGFLPGDLHDKLNPYVRPIYDALQTLLDSDDVTRLEELGVIEVAPLAYMRGRTLSEAFVILDEAQNTTVGQMKMFLTRLGEDSRMVVTGDPTQNDLDPRVKSGLNDAIWRLRGYQEIGMIEFEASDVVRHPLVERIVRAYGAPAGGRGNEDKSE
ncbi:MAG: phosphate starvation-inducible PhoH-like protein [Planctomycetota bacterium]